jgi:hypothetical protein
MRKPKRIFKSTAVHTSAYLEDGKGGRIVVHIPVSLKGVVPEEPKIVLFEQHAYLQTCQNPLTYVNVLTGRAKLI